MHYLKILIFLLIVGLSACTMDNTTVPNTSGSVGKLSGTVKNEEGAPLKDVTIGTKPEFREAVTNDRGDFVIVRIPAGTYTVEASKDGYITAFADVKVVAGYASNVNMTLKKKNQENNPPLVPHNPQPEDEATTKQTALTLQWECGDPDGDDLVYDVYFGIENPPDVKIAEGISGKSINVNGLKSGIKYYWKVVARDIHGAETSGDVWAFTVVERNNPPNKPYNPDPKNNATIIENEYNFTWECQDPDGDELMYDFYLAEGETELILQAHNLNSEHFNFRGLQTGKNYRWKVVARDVYGAETSGDVWRFAVKHTNRAPVAPFNPDPADLSVLDKSGYRFTWQCYDPDGDTLHYDFYLGIGDNPLILIHSNLFYRYFQVSNLKDKSIYHWKVVAKDGHGGETESRIWAFTTQFGLDILLKDLLAFYPFNGNAEDAGPNKLDGINYGATLATDRFGTPHAAFYFGRGDEYVELPTPTMFAFKGDFTIAYWIKPDLSACKPDETHIDVINKSGSTPLNSWYSGFTTKLGPEFWVNNDFIGYDFVKLKNLVWNHIAIVFRKSRLSDNGSYILYLNGARVGNSKVLPTPTNLYDNVRIGDRKGASSFGGWLDDIYFFNRALSDNEIVQLMQIRH